MKKLFTITFLFIGSLTYAQKEIQNSVTEKKTSCDLKTEINQTAFDKVTGSLNIPLVLFEHDDPFQGKNNEPGPGIITDSKEQNNKSYSYEEMESLFSWAIEGTPTKVVANNADIEIKNQIRNQWLAAQEEVKSVQANYKYAVQNFGTPGYNGPAPADFEGGDLTIDELKNWDKLKIKEIFQILSKQTSNKAAFVKAHLAYAKVELNEKPDLLVNSPSFKAQNINVTVTARGELWAKIPTFRCCRRVLGICVWVCFDGWKWTKIGSITVSPKIGANVTIDFSVQSLKIFATGSFDKLFLDYIILREINLAGIANSYMRNKKFELYDVSKFVASVPYINQKFRIQNIKLPAKTGSVEIDIDIINQ